MRQMAALAAKPSEQTCGGRVLAAPGRGVACQSSPISAASGPALRAEGTGNGHSDLSAECPSRAQGYQGSGRVSAFLASPSEGAATVGLRGGS